MSIGISAMVGQGICRDKRCALVWRIHVLFLPETNCVMTQKHQIQLFEEKRVRTVWDDQESLLRARTLRLIGVNLSNVSRLKEMKP